MLRANGFARVRADGARRLYSLDPEGLRTADEWLGRYRASWLQRLDALGPELHRGRHRRPDQPDAPPAW